MKNSKLFLVLAAIVAAVLIISTYTAEDDISYVDRINSKHKEQTKTISALPVFEKEKTFEGLTYYRPDEKFRTLAKLEPIINGKTLKMPTSTGETWHYREYAYAQFELNGEPQQLLILEVVDRGPGFGKLFLAFTDATSGDETYGGGRYMNIEKDQGNQFVELDFNLAYNPYCAYSDEYSCPLPPKENNLQIAIRAGEKNYPSR